MRARQRAGFAQPAVGCLEGRGLRQQAPRDLAAAGGREGAAWSPVLGGTRFQHERKGLRATHCLGLADDIRNAEEKSLGAVR